nr:integrase, catalytic region, zinc finger, CCHC-type, peptidase aspartic, catalytic [Tanacetum cinerariifolium]
MAPSGSDALYYDVHHDECDLEVGLKIRERDIDVAAMYNFVDSYGKLNIFMSHIHQRYPSEAKGLIKAVKEVMPYVEHRQCARHIYEGFRKQYIDICPNIQMLVVLKRMLLEVLLSLVYEEVEGLKPMLREEAGYRTGSVPSRRFSNLEQEPQAAEQEPHRARPIGILNLIIPRPRSERILKKQLAKKGKEHGEMLLNSILKGPFEYQVFTFTTDKAMGIPAQTWMQAFKDLTPEEKIRKECDIRAGNIILYGLPNDIYTLLNQKMIAYEIWYSVKELMEGTELTKQEKESK